MKQSILGIGGLLGTVAIALLMSIGAAPLAAVSETVAPTSVPLSVIIPGPTATPTPTPSPSSSVPGRGSTGAGNSPVVTPPAGPPARNPDGSPIPPAAPAGKPGLKPADDRGKPGELFFIEGDGFTPGERAQVVVYSEPIVLGSYTVDANGTLSASVRLPEDLPPGDHTIEATGWESGHAINAEFRVVSDTTVIGGAPSLWVYLVIGALVIGTIALIIVFRQSISIALGFRPSPVRIAS